MTSSGKIRINSKASKNMGDINLKDLVGKEITKLVPFMGQKLQIKKLTVNEVLAIQELAKDAGDNEEANFELLRTVVRKAAKGADELSDDDFHELPIEELSTLSNAIMTYSGMGEQKGKESYRPKRNFFSSWHLL